MTLRDRFRPSVPQVLAFVDFLVLAKINSAQAETCAF
jgi:hypothetical protein